MARITIEDCLKYIPNRFKLTIVASNRARQLATSNATPLVDPGRDKPDKPTVIALREIAAGKIGEDYLNKQTANRVDLTAESADPFKIDLSMLDEEARKKAELDKSFEDLTTMSFMPADDPVTPAAKTDDGDE